MGGTGGRHVGVGITSATRVALPALTASLALEVAPVRVNLIAAGFVDTALSASLPRRSARSTARRAPRDASDRAGGRTGRRRRAGRPHHGQHRADGGDVRHRRRPAAPLRLSLRVAPRKAPIMRSDIVPGATLPDYELPDHENVPRRLS